MDVVDTTEALSHIDRPRKGTYTYLQFLFDLVEEVEGILPLAVHLVDEDHDGSLSHTAHLHQAACLGLYALRSIDDDDDAVDSGEGTEGIFGEVLVTRRVEDVDLVASILEAHDGGSYGDTALFLDLHPVTGSSLLDLVTLDSTSYVDGSPEEEELLGEGGLTSIRVADDSERASLVDLVFIFVHIGEAKCVKCLTRCRLAPSYIGGQAWRGRHLFASSTSWFPR